LFVRTSVIVVNHFPAMIIAFSLSSFSDPIQSCVNHPCPPSGSGSSVYFYELFFLSLDERTVNDY
jgi:hypothetical protein